MDTTDYEADSLEEKCTIFRLISLAIAQKFNSGDASAEMDIGSAAMREAGPNNSILATSPPGNV